MDYAVLQSLNHNSGPTVVTAQPAAAGAPTMVVGRGDYDAPTVIYQEESHFWRNFFLFIVGLFVVAAIVAALIHYADLDED